MSAPAPPCSIPILGERPVHDVMPSLRHARMNRPYQMTGTWMRGRRIKEGVHHHAGVEIPTPEVNRREDQSADDIKHEAVEPSHAVFENPRPKSDPTFTGNEMPPAGVRAQATRSDDVLFDSHLRDHT